MQPEILKIVSFNRSQYCQYFKKETKLHFKEFSPTFVISKVFDSILKINLAQQICFTHEQR